MTSDSPPTGELPAQIDSVSQLEELLTTPSPALVESLGKLQGDLLILGVGGKMGPTLARLARRALDQAGSKAQVSGVDLMFGPELQERMTADGIKLHKADLLEPGSLAKLPDAQNVIYMAGRKFGSTGEEELTWAMNAYLPALVADRYRDARIVAFSTGNVYPFTPVDSTGPTENEPVGPVGEYAQSCLARERMFQFFSGKNGTAVTIVRLNYAIDLRYGVLIDVARKVYTGEPINLAMGYANVIWQGDANTAVLRCIEHCASPPFILNLTGLETISIRQTAEAFGKLLGKKPVLEGTEAPNALLSNAGQYAKLMGPPRVSVEQMIQWAAHWITIGGASLGKPTHYEARDGKF